MPSQKKVNQVENLTAKLEKNSSFVLLKFEKTSHKTFESLRKQLKKSKSKLTVIKNSILEKTINKLSSKEKILKELRKKFFPLKDNSAFLTFDSDWNIGLNVFSKFAEKEKTLTFKLGIIDGEIYDDKELARIASLPPREQLIAKIIGGLKSPSTKLVYALKYNTDKLVYILKQKSKQN